MPDYKLALTPNAPYVTTGATTHFVLRPTNFVAEVIPFDRFYAKLTELTPSTEPYAMTIAEQLRHEGRQVGELLAQRRALLAVLEARGLPIPDDVRARVESCDDPAQLQLWIVRAATVHSVDLLFD